MTSSRPIAADPPFPEWRPEWVRGPAGDLREVLSQRQQAILSWVAAGKGNIEIGAILNLGRKTVEREVGTVFRKLGVENRFAAASRFFEWLSSPAGGGGAPRKE